MGTPQFAVESLKVLSKSHHQIVGVVTATDKPAGRGQKLMPSPVKEFALEQNFLIMQPEKLKSKEFIQQLTDLNADLFVVVAFRMLPEIVWMMPPKGTINLHSSLLPQYRGAAPINWAIINGETESGITTFFIEKEMDKGNIIDQEKVTIEPEMNAGELHDVLMIKGSQLLLKTINKIELGKVESISQDKLESTEIKEAFKIFKETCQINWDESNVRIQNLVRGLSPYPAAFSNVMLEDHQLSAKIFKTTIVSSTDVIEPGKIITDGKSYLHVGCGKGLLAIEEIQMPGKSRLKIREFLNGVRGKNLFFIS
jgi:methionyl-tRNA formyltransferase